MHRSQRYLYSLRLPTRPRNRRRHSPHPTYRMASPSHPHPRHENSTTHGSHTRMAQMALTGRICLRLGMGTRMATIRRKLLPEIGQLYPLYTHRRKPTLCETQPQPLSYTTNTKHARHLSSKRRQKNLFYSCLVRQKRRRKRHLFLPQLRPKTIHAISLA